MSALIGDNRPDPTAEVVSRLAGDYPTLPSLVDRLKLEASALPEEVTDKAQHDVCVDFINRTRTRIKEVEGTRIDEKDIFLRSERAVDGFFVPIREGAAKVSAVIQDRVQTYLRKVAAEERRKHEEEAERQRQIAAEARKREAEAAAKAEEARRRDYRATHEQKATDAAVDAKQAEGRAREAAILATATPADLARTRTEHGGLSTLKSEWVFDVEDAAKIPLDTLRPYIPVAAIEKAISAYVKMGGRQLAGVRIYETEKAMIR